MTGPEDNLPREALRPDLPAGTARAAAAGEALAPVFCAHGIEFHYVAKKGGYLPAVIEPDALHPDIPVRSPGALPDVCQPSTAHDPTQRRTRRHQEPT